MVWGLPGEELRYRGLGVGGEAENIDRSLYAGHFLLGDDWEGI